MKISQLELATRRPLGRTVFIVTVALAAVLAVLAVLAGGAYALGPQPH